MTPGEIESLAGVTRTLGTAGFGDALDDFVRTVADFDMSGVFAFHPELPPFLVCDGYSAGTPENVLASYLRGGYLLDPFFEACVSGVADGLWRMADIAPDRFFESEFAQSPQVHPCISDTTRVLVEEIGFIATAGESWRVVYSLMRDVHGMAFSDSEFLSLARLAPLVCALIGQHVQSTGVPGASSGRQHVRSALDRAFSDTLTHAQYRVINLTLRGHSNASTAQTLGIAEGTVRIHRHNAYERLGICSQSELFRLFVESLEACSRP